VLWRHIWVWRINQVQDQTLTGLLKDWDSKAPERVALREKRYGIWKTITWNSFNESVENFSRGLISLGMKPGDVVSIIGDNAPEWLIAEFAAMRVGGSGVGVYADMMLEEIVYLINSSNSRFMVVEDQEQVDKLVDVWDRIKENIAKVVVWDSRGMSHYFDRYPFLIHMDNVYEIGKKDAKAGEILNHISVTSDNMAIMLPTSGTTGLPKLAMITHGNLIASADIWQKIHPTFEWDEVYSLLPLTWMGEQFSVARMLRSGFCYSFPEGKESVKADLVELQPTLSTLSPRMYEDICSDIRARMEDASFLKKVVYRFSLKLGLEEAENYLEGGEKSWFLKRWLYLFCMSTTLRSLRQRVGLARTRLAFTGGAAIGREVFTFYLALGINLTQLYGMTENCATASCHYPGDIRPETVGKPLPGVEIRIDDNGMIYVKSPTNIKGYFNNPEETEKTFRDGWLETGDSGYFDEYGHLVVLDRQKDLMFLNNGSRFAPQDLENRLKFSPYIREAVVFGDKRDMIATMISIDMENVGNWANKRNIAYTTFTDLSQNRRVIDLIKDQVSKINDRLPESMRLGRFALLPKELHPDDEELTRTRKVKRNVVNERYGGLIEALYQGSEYYDLDIQIRYMDGKVSRLQNRMKLEDL